MDGLIDYERRRLDLAGMSRAVLHIARGCHDGQREEQARQLLVRLASGRFQLATACQFSRGKTTLMNALLGAACLPVGALPMTPVVTTVRYGSRPGAAIRRRGCSRSASPARSPVSPLKPELTQLPDGKALNMPVMLVHPQFGGDPGPASRARRSRQRRS